MVNCYPRFNPFNESNLAECLVMFGIDIVGLISNEINIQINF